MKKGIAILTLLFTWSMGMFIVQGAVMKASEIQVDDVSALVPFIIEGGSKEVMDTVNRDFADRMTSHIQSYITGRNQFRNNDVVPEEIKKNVSFTGTYTVAYNGGPWVSIIEKGYSYTGGAHGMPFEEGVTVNLSTGKVYSLGDLFQQKFDYKSYLTQRVQAEAAARKDLHLLAMPQVTEKQDFYLNDTGLVLFYPPYAIAPYAAGFISFTIPYEELDGRWVAEVSDIAPVFTVAGEQPFWRMHIRPGDLIYFEGLGENKASGSIPYSKPLFIGDRWVYKLGAEDGETLEIIKQPVGKAVKYQAVLNWKGRIYTGIAIR